MFFTWTHDVLIARDIYGARSLAVDSRGASPRLGLGAALAVLGAHRPRRPGIPVCAKAGSVWQRERLLFSTNI